VIALPNIKVLGLIILNYGTTVNDDVWNNLIRTSKLMNLCGLINFCIGTYYMITIGPFFNSCGIYSGHTACTAVQLIAFVTFIGWCCIGLIPVYIIVFVVAYVATHGDDAMHNRSFMPDRFSVPRAPRSDFNEPVIDSVFHRHDPIMISASKFLEKYNPIPDPEPLSKCGICQETVEENSTDPWTRLECSHIGHVHCLAEWYKHEPSCPYCRKKIEILNLEHTRQIEV
jgi:hypothetical protein